MQRCPAKQQISTAASHTLATRGALPAAATHAPLPQALAPSKTLLARRRRSRHRTFPHPCSGAHGHPHRKAAPSAACAAIQRCAGTRPSPPLTWPAAARLSDWHSHAHAPAAGPPNCVRPPLLQLQLLPARPNPLTPPTLAPPPSRSIPCALQHARAQGRRAMCPARCRCSGAASWASARRAWPDVQLPQSPPRSVARSALATAPAGS